MTQQLQQSIKLLQCSAQELREFVDLELEKNPLLQESEGEEGTGIESADPDMAKRDSASEEPQETNFEDNAMESDFGSGSDWDDTNEIETDYLRYDQQFSTQGAGYDSEDSFGIEDNALPQKTLREHLLEQLQLSVDDPMIRMIGAQLIDLVDESGYLKEDIPQLAEQLGAEEGQIEQTRTLLQSFDPVGICAKDLQECLQLQLKEHDRYDPAMQTLIDNLQLLGDAKFEELQKRCKVDVEDLREMINEIRALNPKPGQQFEHETIQSVEPDIFVRRLPDGNWHVELNMNNFPRVMVNKRYYKQVSKDTRNKKDKDFLSEQFGSANWLVRALEQRAQTTLKVGSELVKQQDAFFRLGVRYLKPMTLKDIAAATGYHESTISRVTNGKFLICPRGTFELKYFFTSALSRAIGSGDDVSSQSVKNHIQELIDKEPHDAILSDDEIVKLLKDRNITVARRTVAKYREALNIPSSPKRKRLKNNNI